MHNGLFVRCEPGRVRCAVVMSQGSSPVTICWSRCITRYGRVGDGWRKAWWKHDMNNSASSCNQGGAPLVSSSGQKLRYFYIGCTAARWTEVMSDTEVCRPWAAIAQLDNWVQPSEIFGVCFWEGFSRGWWPLWMNHWKSICKSQQDFQHLQFTSIHCCFFFLTYVP